MDLGRKHKYHLFGMLLLRRRPWGKKLFHKKNAILRALAGLVDPETLEYFCYSSCGWKKQKKSPIFWRAGASGWFFANWNSPVLTFMRQASCNSPRLTSIKCESGTAAAFTFHCGFSWEVKKTLMGGIFCPLCFSMKSTLLSQQGLSSVSCEGKNTKWSCSPICKKPRIWRHLDRRNWFRANSQVVITEGLGNGTSWNGPRKTREVGCA